MLSSSATTSFARLFRPVLSIFRKVGKITNKNEFTTSSVPPHCANVLEPTVNKTVHFSAGTKPSATPRTSFADRPVTKSLPQIPQEQAAALVGPLPGTTTCGSSKVQTFAVRVEPGFSVYCTVVHPKAQTSALVRRVSTKYGRRGYGTKANHRKERDEGSEPDSNPDTPVTPSFVEGNCKQNVTGGATTWADIFDLSPRAHGEPTIPFATDEWDRVVVRDTLVEMARTTKTEVAIFGETSHHRRRRHIRR